MVFTSDNGTTYTGGVEPRFFQSVGDLRGLKDAVYEGGIRVPFIARWPGRIAKATVSDALAANWDVLPTIAEIAGAPVGGTIDGVSFAPALFGRNSPTAHPPMYWEHHGVCGGQQAVRDGRWKAVRLGTGTTAPAPVQLFDLDADPGEHADVAGQNPAIVARLTGMMRSMRTPALIDAWNFVVDPARRPLDYVKCAPGNR